MGGNDFVYVLGPARLIFPTLNRFMLNIRQTCSLMLEPSKTQVFSWSGRIPREAPVGMLNAGMAVDGDFFPGFV